MTPKTSIPFVPRMMSLRESNFSRRDESSSAEMLEDFAIAFTCTVVRELESVLESADRSTPSLPAV